METRMPQFLHRPVKVIGLDVMEFGLVFAAYFLFLLFKGYSAPFLIAGLILFIPYQRSKPRGYIGHLFYRIGLGQLKGYPMPVSEKFYE